MCIFFGVMRIAGETTLCPLVGIDLGRKEVIGKALAL